MKKLLYLLSISFLMLQSCSSSDNNNTNTSSVTDIDGNVYQNVTICNQTWTKSNLNVSHYRNGDVIPQVTNATQWLTLTTGAWCYYQNNTANGPVYGKLYNWYAVNDPRGLAPSGWHVPSDVEWAALIDCLGGEATAGGKMKEVGLSHWQSPNTGATNSSGFTALPGGFRDYDGNFLGFNTNSTNWSTSLGTFGILYHNLYNDSNELTLDDADRKNGFSVRCIKD